ncbi:hypothetical protein CLOSTMETH_03327 [[Clostridium] methylpentosum DSM 5476]|uniref:Uncharacterized protein n=1 Tax=[Clostridium] methylpentosum DSM 5476 TaxID=537013 RepID=C0EHC7_9FIRM|nr:hypothetical protein CLOSTMETH_03327 [[Clostridium] methylpentosum DSM 5476]
MVSFQNRAGCSSRVFPIRFVRANGVPHMSGSPFSAAGAVQMTDCRLDESQLCRSGRIATDADDITKKVGGSNAQRT